MNKAIPSFVIGLIFSILGAISATFFMVVTIFVEAFSIGALNDSLIIVTLINILTFAISFIASFFCFKLAKVGGIMMLISSIISLICFAIICITLKTISFLVMIFWIPTVLIFVAGILACKLSKRPSEELNKLA